MSLNVWGRICEVGYSVSVQAGSALRRVTGHVLTVASLVVAAHIVVLCVSGGHLWGAYARNVRALQLDLPLAVLLALIMARWLVGRPARRAALTPALFFFAILFIYVVSPRPLGSGDTMPARYLPLSIVREGNFDLDEFPVLYQPTLGYFLKHVNGHYVSDRPVGAPLLAVPVYLLTALGGADPQRAFSPTSRKSRRRSSLPSPRCSSTWPCGASPARRPRSRSA